MVIYIVAIITLLVDIACSANITVEFEYILSV